MRDEVLRREHELDAPALSEKERLETSLENEVRDEVEAYRDGFRTSAPIRRK